MIVITGGGGFIGSVVACLNEEGRSDRVIVDRFGIGAKWRNIAKRDFSEIVPVDGLFAWLDRFGDRSRRYFTWARSRRRRLTTPTR
jgi:nucleoside-diphosphate-sugar epimerase